MQAGLRALLSPHNHLLVLARTARRPTHPALAVVVAIVGTLLGLLIGAPAAMALVPSVALIGFGGIILVFWAWVEVFERRGFHTLGFELPGAGWKIVRGAALGFGLFVVVLAIMAAFGAVVPAGERPAERGGAVLVPVLLALVGYAVQGPAEEVVCRGWLLPTIGARSRPWIGVAVSSLFFGLVHGLNAGFNPLVLVNLTLVGVFLACWALAEGGLWGVCAWHAFWNWTQGSVFGLSVSGGEVETSLLAFDPAGPALLGGGEFGPEGSIACTLVMLAGTAVIVWRARGLPALPDAPAPGSAPALG